MRADKMLEPVASIGIFDSGVGGLTVCARVADRLPYESLIYLGDTARVPYGTKSGDTVIRYAQSCARLLISRHVKMLVVACNTASAHALDILREELDVPVIGVVTPGAESAVKKTRNGRIGVIGTASTIGSGAYETAIRSFSPEAEIFSKACPLFVPLAEEGWTEGAVPRDVAEIYLRELLDHDIDTLVLGCTHYPLLKKVIAEVAGDSVNLVDSAEATSLCVADTLRALGTMSEPCAEPKRFFLVTDAPDSFARVGKRFLGHDTNHVEWVDV